MSHDYSKWRIHKRFGRWWVYPPLGSFWGNVSEYPTFDQALADFIDQTTVPTINYVGVA